MKIFSFLPLIAAGIFIGFYLAFLWSKIKESKSSNQPIRPNYQNQKKEIRPEAAKPEYIAPEEGSLLEKKLRLEAEMTNIRQLSENLSTNLDLNSLAEKIVETTCNILNLEVCALLILDDAKQELNIIASRGIDDERIKSAPIKKKEEVSGIVAEYNQIIIINDLEYRKDSYSLKHENVYKNSLVSLPISTKDKVLGVLNASDKKSGKPFTAEDIEILKLISYESAIAIQNIKLYTQLQQNYLNTIITLANAIDAKDPYTHRHSENVTRYSVRIAQAMELSNKVVENIRHAALLHDIGKIGVKDEVLLKDGKLSDEEYAQIKMHPSIGEKIIASSPFMEELSGIIKHHHERFDGKGYPDGIKGENIELGARILAISDSFDAMITDRPYRKALSHETAKNELMKNKGSQFDPILVDHFLEILRQEPELIKV